MANQEIFNQIDELINKLSRNEPIPSLGALSISVQQYKHTLEEAILNQPDNKKALKIELALLIEKTKDLIEAGALKRQNMGLLKMAVGYQEKAGPSLLERLQSSNLLVDSARLIFSGSPKVSPIGTPDTSRESTPEGNRRKPLKQ